MNWLKDMERGKNKITHQDANLQAENMDECIKFPDKDDEGPKYQDPETGAHFRYEDVFLRLQYLQQQLKYASTITGVYTEVSDEEGDIFENDQNQNAQEEIHMKTNEKKPNLPIKKAKEISLNKGSFIAKSKPLNPKIQSSSKPMMQKVIKKDTKLNGNDINKKKVTQQNTRVPNRVEENKKVLKSYLPNNWIVKTYDKQARKIQDVKSNVKNKPPSNKIPSLDGGKFFASLYNNAY